MNARSKINVDDRGVMTLQVTFNMSVDEANRIVEMLKDQPHPGWSFSSIIRSALRPLLETTSNEYNLDNWGNKTDEKTS